MTHAIEVNELTKIYGSPGKGVLAVDHISFEVRQGEIFGFLGPNGAGKTTTIRMLTGLTRPTAGGGCVLGLDIHKDMARIKKQVGVVPEVSNLYDELSAFDNLIFDMQLYGVPRHEWATRAEELLTRFRLADKRDILFAKLSRGMKRALTIAAALAHQPSLLFLDEPTTGLDVMSARQLRHMIASLRDQGVTIFLTTHYLEEAERLCDRIAIIVKGKIVALDTVPGLKALVPATPIVEVTLIDNNGTQQVVRHEGQDLNAILRQIVDHNVDKQIVSVHTVQPSLEDIFVKLTGIPVETMLVEKGGRGQSNVAG